MYIFRLVRLELKRHRTTSPTIWSGSPHALDTFRSEPTVASRPKSRALTLLVGCYFRYYQCVPWIRLQLFRLPLAFDPAPWCAKHLKRHRLITARFKRWSSPQVFCDASQSMTSCLFQPTALAPNLICFGNFPSAIFW